MLKISHSFRLASLPIAVGLFLVLLPLWGFSSGQQQETDPDVFVRTYRWGYRNQIYRLKMELPWDAFNYYADRNRFYGNYAIYTYEHPEYAYLEKVTQALVRKARANHLNNWQVIEFITAFVQQLEYVTEIGEYPKFPIETLAAKGGDCEDTSILLAAMLRTLGYDVMLVNPPGHMGVALACKDCDGNAYQVNGRRYFYIETTAMGFQIGEIPKEYRATKDKLYPLNEPLDKLWVLSGQAHQSASGNSGYYIQENDATSLARGKGGDCVMTTRRVRSVTVNGETHTSSSIIRWIQE